MSSTIDLARRCQSLVARLHQTALDPPSGEGRTASCDHLLTTAALVSCLAHDHPERNALRLAALVHALPDEQRHEALAGVDTHVQSWVALLRRQDHELEQGEYPDPAGMGDLERLLTLAHLAASPRREIDSRDAFSTHPLATDDLRVELVYGGATKIKGYVFESARLPEIRGASAILDHINRIDLPALWGQEPALDTPCAERQRQRYDQVRRWFAETFGMSPLDAPECVLYAGGGNILALAPAGWGHRLAAAIERRYTEETLVANSVGVWESFRLLELQYGRCPDVFWIDDAEDLLQKEHHKSVAGFLRQSLGDAGFKHKKGFGELVTLLTAKANSRRAGNDSADDSNAVAPRPTAFIELISAARKCSSCDVRPVQPDSEYAHYQRQLGELGQKGQFFCEPCFRKRLAGDRAKKGERKHDEYAWIQPWADWLEQRSGVTIEATTNDLQDLSAVSDTFVGLIYADGNDVGAFVANLASIDAYRQFSRRMFEANERAVAEALVHYLAGDVRSGVWPFEIITIGGDDVLAFVPAHRALEIALSIAEHFEQDMQGTGISLSVGVMLMPDATPVRFARELVEQLLKSAKKRSKQQHIGSTIDFLSLKGTTMIAETIERYRSATFLREDRTAVTAKPRPSLTQRPYSVEELRRLIAACRELKRSGFPRSQLYQLREIVMDGQLLQSMIDYRYFVGRGTSQAYEAFEREMERLCDDERWLPWRSRQEQKGVIYDTPLLDLIEIYPFVEAGGEA